YFSRSVPSLRLAIEGSRSFSSVSIEKAAAREAGAPPMRGKARFIGKAERRFCLPWPLRYNRPAIGNHLSMCRASRKLIVTSTRRELRPYQVRLVADVSRTTGDALVEQPTGSGKTMQVVTLVAMHLGRRFSHTVIAAPQEQIEHGFVHRDYQTVTF